MSAAIDQIARTLDEKKPGWNLYRAAIGHWVVTVTYGHLQKQVFSGAELFTVLKQAADHKPLPRVPSKPRRYMVCDFKIRKEGRKWAVDIASSSGGFSSWVCNLKTLKEAEKAVAAACDRSAADLQSWDEKFGPLVAVGKEGEDFVYCFPWEV
jgi:hypothetical protein